MRNNLPKSLADRLNKRPAQRPQIHYLNGTLAKKLRQERGARQYLESAVALLGGASATFQGLTFGGGCSYSDKTSYNSIGFSIDEPQHALKISFGCYNGHLLNLKDERQRPITPDEAMATWTALRFPPEAQEAPANAPVVPVPEPPAENAQVAPAAMPEPAPAAEPEVAPPIPEPARTAEIKPASNGSSPRPLQPALRRGVTLELKRMTGDSLAGLLSATENVETLLRRVRSVLHADDSFTFADFDRVLSDLARDAGKRSADEPTARGILAELIAKGFVGSIAEGIFGFENRGLTLIGVRVPLGSPGYKPPATNGPERNGSTLATPVPQKSAAAIAIGMMPAARLQSRDDVRQLIAMAGRHRKAREVLAIADDYLATLNSQRSELTAKLEQAEADLAAARDTLAATAADAALFLEFQQAYLEVQ